MIINNDKFANLDMFNDIDGNDKLLITFEEIGTIYSNFEDLEGVPVFKSTSESGLSASHFEKYIE